MSMTPQEQKVLDLTVELWNAFLDLPDQHPHDAPETMRDLHNIQNRLMARVAVRAHPERFVAGGSQ